MNPEQTSWIGPVSDVPADGIYHKLMEIRAQSGYEPPFTVVKRRVIDEREGTESQFEATVFVKIKGKKDLVIATGSARGPICSLEIALRKALIPHFPSIEGMIGIYCITHTLPNGFEGLDADTQTILKVKNLETGKIFAIRRVAISEPGACEMILIDIYELCCLVGLQAEEWHF
ncbi:MAG: hypothetical protein Q8Q92_02290 [bacterium]|nr:hypothetical protein [bacterium]